MKRKINWQQEVTYFCFVIPALLLYIIFFILPVGMGIYYSLTDWNGLSPNVKFTGIANYQKLFTDSAFLRALKFNSIYAIGLVVAITVLALLLAICLNSKIKLLTFFRGAMFVPAVLSMLTVGMVFNEIFTRAIPAVAQTLGIESLTTNILSNPATAKYGILFVNIWQGLAIPTVLLLAGLQTIPVEMYEVAELDGASKWRQFISITLPFLLPVLSVVLILTSKSGLMVFDYIMALTEGGPAGSTRSLTYNIYILGFTELKFGYAIAQAMVVTAIIVVISYIQIRITNKKRVY